MATIRPTDLPAAASVTDTGVFVVDTGAAVEKATAAQIVDAAIPLASQAEAEAGTDNAKRVTPLRVKQAIDALGVAASTLSAASGGEHIGTGTDETLAQFRAGFGNIVRQSDSRATILAKIAAANAGDGQIFFSKGAYYVSGIVTDCPNLRVLALGGVVQIHKDDDGVIWSHSGDFGHFQDLTFYGHGDEFTGDNLHMTGAETQFHNCGSVNAASLALKATKQVYVYGSNPAWQSLDLGGYEIENGVSGTATLYSQFLDVYTSQSGGGLRFIDCGSQSIKGGQIGKLSIESGTSPIGVNGGHIVGCRIIGDITCELPNAVFSTNLCGGNVTFAAGTSGVAFGPSNVVVADSAVTNLGNSSNYVCPNRADGPLGGVQLCYGASGAGALGAGAEWWVAPSADGSNNPDPADASIGTPGTLFGKALSLLDAAGTALFNAISRPSGSNLNLGDGSGFVQFVTSDSGVIVTADSVEQLRVDSAKITVNPALLGNFTDDATAASGGVAVGQLYRTGSALKMRVS